MNGLFRFLLFTLAAMLSSHAADPLIRREWNVNGVTREALVYLPPTVATRPAPMIFVFHGHGGTMERSASRSPFHEVWPEAIVVYPQGLKTPGVLTDKTGQRSGWQMQPGDLGDRDLHFFDAIRAGLQKDYRIDSGRIFVTGHSNGGAFTYLLWARRGEALTAVAPTAAAAPRLLRQLKPKPAFILAGENDPLVKFAWQQHTLRTVLTLNQCGTGRPWQPGSEWHDSPIHAPVVTFIHSGGHEFPAEATGQIVRFFQEVSRLTGPLTRTFPQTVSPPSRDH